LAEAWFRLHDFVDEFHCRGISPFAETRNKGFSAGASKTVISTQNFDEVYEGFLLAACGFQGSSVPPAIHHWPNGMLS
jgi:hypothetical protein